FTDHPPKGIRLFGGSLLAAQKLERDHVNVSLVLNFVTTAGGTVGKVSVDLNNVTHLQRLFDIVGLLSMSDNIMPGGLRRELFILTLHQALGGNPHKCLVAVTGDATDIARQDNLVHGLLQNPWIPEVRLPKVGKFNITKGVILS